MKSIPFFAALAGMLSLGSNGSRTYNLQTFRTRGKASRYRKPRDRRIVGTAKAIWRLRQEGRV